MDIADFIKMGEQPPALRFLIIGGNAVIAHGFGRLTHDVDFLVNRIDREAWQEKARSAGLTLFYETSTFAQFSQKDGLGFDLMVVSPETFEKMWSQSKEAQFGGASARVPSLDNLLALKIHALKSQPPHRTSKDAQDVEKLARLNKLDLTEKKYEELFLKYGTREIYETILRVLKY